MPPELLITVPAILVIATMLFFRFRSPSRLRRPTTQTSSATSATTCATPAGTTSVTATPTKGGGSILWITIIVLAVITTYVLTRGGPDHKSVITKTETIISPIPVETLIQPSCAEPPQPHIWKEFSFFPNTWDQQNYGWQEVANLEPGTYQITASGYYIQHYTDEDRSYGPEGDPRSAFYQDALPVPNSNVCSLIGKIGGKVFPISSGTTICVTEPATLFLSINNTQGDAVYGNPKMNFIKNRGCLNILICKS